MRILLLTAAFIAGAAHGAVVLPPSFRQAVAERFAVWPSDYGAPPDQLARSSPNPKPSFWTDDWTTLNQIFARQAYVVLTLEFHDQGLLLDREEERLLEIIAQINWLASNLKGAELAASDDVLRFVFTEGLRDALRAIEVGGVTFDRRRLETLLRRLSARTAGTRDLSHAAARLRREWRLTDGEARTYRVVQLAGFWLLVAASGRYFAVISPQTIGGLAFGLGVVGFTDAARTYLPLAWRFEPYRNRVGRHVGDCLNLLTPPSAESPEG